MLTVMFVMYNY